MLCLLKAPDCSNKKLDGQYLGREVIGRDSGRDKRGASQSDSEKAGKQDGQYVDEVNGPQGNTQINGNGLI